MSGYIEGLESRLFLSASQDHAAPPALTRRARAIVADQDDQMTEAVRLGAIASPRSISRSLSDSTDVDLFAFSATAGQPLKFTASRGGSQLRLRFFDGKGRDLTRHLSRTTSSVTFPRDGAYYVGISHPRNNAYNPKLGTRDKSGPVFGRYVLRISPASLFSEYSPPQIGTVVHIVPPTVEVITPPNILNPPPAIVPPTAIDAETTADVGNTFETAFALDAITAPRAVNAALTPPNDTDVFSFTAQTGQLLTFTARGEICCNFYLDLFDAAGQDLHPLKGGNLMSAAVQYRFTSPGTYFLKMSTMGDLPGTPKNPYVLAIIPDVDDPDDQTAEAIPLGNLYYNRTVSGELSCQRDVDLYHFRISSTDWAELRDIWVPISVTSPSGVTVRLFGECISMEPANQYLWPYQKGLSAKIQFNHDYYIGISENGNTDYDYINNGLLDTGSVDSPPRTYSFTIDFGHPEPLDPDASAAPGDDPNDQISEAEDLPWGYQPSQAPAAKPRPRAIGPSLTDVDLYRIDATVIEELLTFQVIQDAGTFVPGGQITLRLFDSQGNQISSAVSTDRSDGSREVVLEHACTEHTVTGTLYLGVSNAANASYNPVTGEGDAFGAALGSYKINVSNSPDPDNYPGYAIQLGDLTQRRIADADLNAPWDADMFSFTALAGQRVHVEVLGQPGDLDLPSDGMVIGQLRIELCDSTGKLVIPDYTAPNPTYFEHTIPETGTYYIRVLRCRPDDGTRYDYRLAVWAEPTDLDDQIGEATWVGELYGVRTVAVYSQLATPTDVDMYIFRVRDNTSLSFWVSEGIYRLRLFDDTGSEIDTSHTHGPSSPPHIQHTFAVGGTYYISVSSPENDAFDPVTGDDDVAGTAGVYFLDGCLSEDASWLDSL